MRALSRSSLALAALSPLALALQDSDLQAVFPTVSDLTSLTSAAFSAGGLDVVAVANGSHVLVVCNRTDTAIGDVGYIGHGLGTEMATADILVMWPNEGANWTFSHREPQHHVPPPPIPYGALPWTILPDLTSTFESSTSWTSVGFLRPFTFSAAENYSTMSKYTSWAATQGQQLVWSYSTAHPGNSSPEAMLAYHDGGQGVQSIDLAQPYALGQYANGVPASGQGSMSSPLNRQITAHAFLGSLVFLVICPMALLSPRLFRHYRWFQVHFFLQVATSVLIWIVFALGYSEARDPSFSKQHHFGLGLVIPLLVLVQSALGLWGHMAKRDWTRSRPVKNWVHVVLGILLQGLGYVQVKLGYSLWTSMGKVGIGRIVPLGITATYWVLVALEVAAYCAGIGLSPRTFLGRPHANSEPTSGLIGKEARAMKRFPYPSTS